MRSKISIFAIPAPWARLDHEPICVVRRRVHSQHLG